MARIRGQKRNWKTQEKVDLSAPLPSPRAPVNPSSDWWENFSRRFSGYTPDSLFKVSRKTFEYICGLVEEEMMTGQNCADLRREYLILNDRVAMALTRLCTGESFETVGNLFRVNISTVYYITWRFVEAIEKKGFHHLHWPKTEEQITKIKSKFEGIGGLPNCCGAIETSKIMFCLSSDHAQRKIWCDRENNPCMILQAVVDPDMRFLDIIAGLPGSLSEPDVLCEWSFFNLCDEGKRLNGKKLKLAENEEEIGEYIVGNGGFPLLPWLLTPYNQEKKLCDFKEDFNKRHYETWKVAKMAFERLKENWQIIQGVLWSPDKHKLPRIIYACCVLHNIMIDQKDGFILQDQSFLQSDDNSPQVHQQKCKFRDKTASVQRDNLALYLSSKLPPFSSNGIESVSRLVVLTDFQPLTDTTVVGRGKTLPYKKGESAARAVGHSIRAEVEATHAKKASKNKGKGLAVADPAVEEEGTAAARAKMAYDQTPVVGGAPLAVVDDVDISVEMARFQNWLNWKFSRYRVQMETISQMRTEDEWVFKVLNCKNLSDFIDISKGVEAMTARVNALKKGKVFEDKPMLIDFFDTSKLKEAFRVRILALKKLGKVVEDNPVDNDGFTS